MTNKLPTFGDRYKATAIFNVVYCHGELATCVMRIEGNAWEFLLPTQFIKKYFVELPEDKAETINCGNISCEYKSECDSSRRILPKIDQIYIKKTRYARITNVDSEGVTYLEQDGKEFWDCFKDFLDFFEPAEAETKPEIQSHISELSPEVREAMEVVRSRLRYPPYIADNNEKAWFCEKLHLETQNLLNALDKQFNKKSESVVEDDCPAEVAADEWNSEIFASNKIEAEESIWKPVSELPKKPALPFQCFIKDLSSKVHLGVMCNGILQLEGDNSIWPANNHAFLSISDFINHYEKLEERVKKLEEKLNDK